MCFDLIAYDGGSEDDEDDDDDGKVLGFCLSFMDSLDG